MTHPRTNRVDPLGPGGYSSHTGRVVVRDEFAVMGAGRSASSGCGLLLLLMLLWDRFVNHDPGRSSGAEQTMPKRPTNGDTNTVTTNQPTDRELVTSAKAGDFNAFEELVNRHEGRIYTLAVRILRQREDAEDVVQTAFLKALEKIAEFREEAAFGTWIGRIATNTALNMLRKRRGLPMASPLDSNDSNDPPINPPDYVADWRTDMDRIIEQRELRRILDQAIDELPENYRLIFTLRDLEGMSVRESAEALGISESNVKVRLMRARMALREKLTDVFGDAEKRFDRPPILEDFETLSRRLFDRVDRPDAPKGPGATRRESR